jgi:hypothetical protein
MLSYNPTANSPRLLLRVKGSQQGKALWPWARDLTLRYYGVTFTNAPDTRPNGVMKIPTGPGGRPHTIAYGVRLVTDPATRPIRAMRPQFVFLLKAKGILHPQVVKTVKVRANMATGAGKATTFLQRMKRINLERQRTNRQRINQERINQERQCINQERQRITLNMQRQPFTMRHPPLRHGGNPMN